jgi:3-hydroxyisobutyrate dehydrogenase-like beta-hydroxyacid dehydrogenase
MPLAAKSSSSDAGAAVETTPAAVAGATERTICMVETTEQAEAVIIGEQGKASSPAPRPAASSFA